MQEENPTKRYCVRCRSFLGITMTRRNPVTSEACQAFLDASTIVSLQASPHDTDAPHATFVVVIKSNRPFLKFFRDHLCLSSCVWCSCDMVFHTDHMHFNLVGGSFLCLARNSASLLRNVYQVPMHCRTSNQCIVISRHPKKLRSHLSVVAT